MMWLIRRSSADHGDLGSNPGYGMDICVCKNHFNVRQNEFLNHFVLLAKTIPRAHSIFFVFEKIYLAT